MANSVTGLALAYDALQAPDAHDPGCHAQRVQPVAGVVQGASPSLPGLKGLRIGVLNGYFDDHASAAVREVVALAARTLGATASVSWPDAGLARAAAFIITASEGGSLHLDDLRTQQPCRAAMGLLTQPISFVGCPVVTAPMWPTSTNGMPLGVQIIAAPWREDLAFAVARQLSDAGVAHVKPAAC